MTDFKTLAEIVTIQNQELAIESYQVKPVGSGPWPGIIVFQEIFGVNAHIRSVTQRIAQLGYVAIAPAIYQRQVANLELGYSEAEVQLGRQYKMNTRAEELLSDTQATITYLNRLPEVRSGCIGTLGFCFGGHVAYLVATLPEIKATASFYGAGIATMIPGGGPPTVTKTSEIQGRLFGFFGTQDPSIPQSEVDLIEQTLRLEGVDFKIFQYPAGHGFFCDQRPSYDPEAADDAWHQVQTLFQETLLRDC
ncbi:dienelactone hydrolase family protein [Lyngbya confervoides]|uniref:Dienelactone hydrolase family protein n=1 Tax=Lyngbya confervoides BDU141951 TaxID=1574623 RepID=A0ABD4T0F9_9CYAN|nr:dienelactone hydrolase family protein [Lyngbya confervoides]MCM1981915.1 dienelactone hydrolase family protein [Lyngbya confervoides BDU141951]